MKFYIKIITSKICDIELVNKNIPRKIHEIILTFPD